MLKQPKRILANEKGLSSLEFVPAFVVFFAVLSLTINFFIYAYCGTLMSLAAQEAGRSTIASFRTEAGARAGHDYLERFGVGSLIKTPAVSVTVQKAPNIRDSVISATVSGSVAYMPLGTVFFEKDGVTSKTVKYYLEETFQANEREYVVNRYGRDIRGECQIRSWGDRYDC